MKSAIRCLLLQVRDADDPMREHEVGCFARALEVRQDDIAVHDLLDGVMDQQVIEQTDIVLFGGSGSYSAAGEGDWLERALDTIKQVHAVAKPTFASCWGFQAMARALGGRVVTDPDRSEVGTHRLTLTEAGLADPVFGPVGPTFYGQMGHEDRVAELPPGAIRLASSALVENQAYRFDGLPIYCTQFHPELRADDLIVRIQAYPEYIERIAGVSLEDFIAGLRKTPETESLLKRFVEEYVL